MKDGEVYLGKLKKRYNDKILDLEKDREKASWDDGLILGGIIEGLNTAIKDIDDILNELKR